MEAYIVGAYRTAIGKAKKGGFRFTRPDELAAKVITKLLSDFPQIEKSRIDDIIVGNVFPEAESGTNIARMISLICMGTVEVPGVTVNRFCASGLEAIAWATTKIRMGMDDIIVAGGTESMSLIPMGGWRYVPNSQYAKEHPDWYHGMGLTAEAVAREYKISREDQDFFAAESVARAVDAIDNGRFKDEIVPITVKETYVENNRPTTREFVVDTDEGPRRGTTPEGLSKLKPVFAEGGTVTAGNASQTSDGAAFVLVVSEAMVKEYNLKPIARLVDYQVSGLEPYKMGVGPIYAIPKVLKHSGLSLNDMELIELNEAFASQSLAVQRELDLNPEIVNVNGGAIALGHPLGTTGAKLTAQLLNEMRRRKNKYGMVTMCVGSGQGAAGIFEML